ncbi:MAG: hypothetical protein JWM38_1262 [Sphingomonas bacterium]|jgi:hypothetical protein|nr:hypothetical protein [Sphingomonas bacterium]MDB5717835.1 hypothetical protein [Sphingomonas bacterium]
MNRDRSGKPEQLSGYTGEQEPARTADTGPAPTTGGTTAASNRGQRAPDSGSGGVVGSGASAGGGGGPEDYDSDPQGGGGKVQIDHGDAAPDKGGDAPIGGSH